MQNDLKYGKLSEMGGINGYFAGNNRKKIAPAPKISHIIFKGGGGKNSTFSKNILPCLLGISQIKMSYPNEKISHTT